MYQGKKKESITFIIITCFMHTSIEEWRQVTVDVTKSTLRRSGSSAIYEGAGNRI